MKILKQIVWLFNNRCQECGGELEGHINGKDECLSCGLIQGSKK